MNFVGQAEPLTAGAFRRAAEALSVNPATLMAVLAVESKGCGFLPSMRPVILFERHIFHARTGGAFSAYPSISHPSPGCYAGMEGEYPRLEAAMRLNSAAALMSTSWGAGQIMGFNHMAAGYPSVDLMVRAVAASEDAQLSAVVLFLTTSGLRVPLAARQWAAFAKGYNGPAYARNRYDERLAAAYAYYRTPGALPNAEIRAAQMYLMYAGYAPGVPDGIAGSRTMAAVRQFCEDTGGHQPEKPEWRSLILDIKQILKARKAA